MEKTESRSFAIIGGGIVGLATAYKLSERFPGARITLLEKESGRGTPPDRPQQRRAALRPLLQARFRESPTGRFRHPPDGRLLPGKRHPPRNLRQARGRHRAKSKSSACAPCSSAAPPTDSKDCAGWSARRCARSSRTWAAWPRSACRRKASWITPACAPRWSPNSPVAGSRVVTGARADRMIPSGGGWTIETTAGEFAADFLINCAGLHCDRVAEHAGERREVRILPVPRRVLQDPPRAPAAWCGT